NHVAFTYDGSRRPDGFAIFMDGKSQSLQRSDEPSLKGSIVSDAPLQLGFAGRRDFKGGALQDLRIYGRALRPEEVTLLFRWPQILSVLAKEPQKLSAPERDELLTLYVNRVEDAYRQTANQLLNLENEQRQIRLRSAVTHVMQERAD